MRGLLLRWIVVCAVLGGVPHMAKGEGQDVTDMSGQSGGTIGPFKERAGKPESADYVVGFGFVISQGYNDVLKDAYPGGSVSGGYGWMDMQFGVRFNESENWSFTPAVDVLVNFVSGDASFINKVILPSVSARYSFNGVPSFYLGGELNYGIPKTGGRIDTGSNGLGFGVVAGYAFDWGMEVEMGYLGVPVKVNDSKAENLGGFALRAKWVF